MSDFDDDLLRRAIEARNPLLCKDFLPFTMTPAEMRQAAERRRGYRVRRWLRRLCWWR